MGDLKIILVVIFGITIGVFVGFMGPFLICYTYDAMTDPSPGSGLMTVGWVFCFITIPVGAIAGGIFSGVIANKKLKRPEE